MIDREYFCAAAWTALYLHTDGTVDFCCTAHNNLGNIKEQSIQEILDGPRAREIRTRMINNQRVEGCVACWRQDPQHRMQTFFNNKYIQQQPIGGARSPDPDLTSDFYQSPDNTKLKYLDLRWNNTCNFACIYCGEQYSSLWSEENHRHQGLIPITVKTTREDKQIMREDLTDTLADIDWIYFAGGEPLAIKENISILDQLYAVNPSCTLQINTNLSMLDNNAMFDRLTKFSNVRWMVSGETMGDVFEYVRWPGNWLTFTHNIQRIAALRDQGHQITFNLVAMNINHMTLWDYVDYLLELDVVEKPSDININMYNNRESSQPFAIQRMPLEWKDQARDRLARSSYQIRGVDNYLDALTDPLPALHPRWSGLEHTVNRLRQLDQQRAKDSRVIFPHVYEYIYGHPE